MKQFARYALAAAFLCLPVAVHASAGQPDEYGLGRAFIATLTGAQENPIPVTTDGMGYALLTYDTKTNTLCVALSFSGLSGDAIAAHVHGPGDPDESVGILITLGSGSPVVSPVNQCGVLDNAGEKALKAGRLYINVHTALYPGGEVRGQILPIIGPNYKD